MSNRIFGHHKHVHLIRKVGRGHLEKEAVQEGKRKMCHCPWALLWYDCKVKH